MPQMKSILWLQHYLIIACFYLISAVVMFFTFNTQMALPTIEKAPVWDKWSW